MYKRTPLSVEVKKVLKLLSYTMVTLLVVSSAYFFIKMSFTAESGYSMRENQLRQQVLEDENRILKKRLLDAQSLEALQQSKVLKEMEEPESTVYVLPKGPLTKRK